MVAGGAVAAVGAVVGAVRRVVGVGVLGADQAAVDVEVAVAVEGDDHAAVGAGRLGVLVAVGAGALDVGVALLVAGDGRPQFAPAVAIDAGIVERLAGLLDHRLGLVEGAGLDLGELGAHIGAGDEVLLLVDPGELELYRGPLPRLGVLGRLRVQLLLREFAHQVRIEDGDVVVLEQRILDRAAGGAVGVEADEQRGRRVGARLALAERLPDVVAVELAGLAEALENGALEVGVAGDGERLRGVRVDASLAVGGDDLFRQAAEADALLHGPLGHAEPGRDLLGGGASAREPAERGHLVGRVHRDAHGVLGERGLGRGVVVDHEARHRVVLRDVLLAGESVQRAEPAGAGGDPVEGLGERRHHEVLEQAVGADRGDEFGVGLGRCRVAPVAAYVAVVVAQSVERDELRPRGRGGGCRLHGAGSLLHSGMAVPAPARPRP